MNEGVADRRARVERVLVHGRRIADRGDALGAEARARLPAATGLSPEGVELALTEILETQPSEEELAALLLRPDSAARCHVVLSAHVCTAALRAIAVALAAAPIVYVRPSRRDPVLAELFVRELSADPVLRDLGATVELVADVRTDRGDLLDVYGSDETLLLHRAAHPSATLRGHGSGAGLAVVDLGTDAGQAAASIAADVAPFDQRGCLSPRWVVVEGDAERAEAVAARLDTELEAIGRRVPRGALDEATRAELALYRATAQAVGTFREGPHHALSVDPTPRALPLPPAARVVHVASSTPVAVASLLAPWRRRIAAVGGASGALTRAVWALCPDARRSELGRMQRPPLDGPVDLRGW